MDQNRKSDQMPSRSSNMEPAEGSRETVMNSGNDLGTSSDRAMFDDRMDDSDRSSSDRDSSSMRGVGSSGERSRSNAGGITNRPLEQEQDQQDQLPPRGHSQSER